jgi:hypothetical protein
MKVNNNENEEGPAQSAAGARRILERQFAYGETAGLELLKRITLPSAMSARISYLRRPGYDCRLLGRYPVGIVRDRSWRCCHWSAQ